MRQSESLWGMERKRLHVSKKFWDLTLRKTKLDFKIQFRCRNKWPQHYITLQMKSRCKKCQNLLVSGNQIFWKLSGVFCFYFRKFSPRVYLTKQHNCFANRKSYRTSLLKKLMETRNVIKRYLPNSVFIISDSFYVVKIYPIQWKHGINQLYLKKS